MYCPPVFSFVFFDTYLKLYNYLNNYVFDYSACDQHNRLLRHTCAELKIRKGMWLVEFLRFDRKLLLCGLWAKVEFPTLGVIFSCACAVNTDIIITYYKKKKYCYFDIVHVIILEKDLVTSYRLRRRPKKKFVHGLHYTKFIYFFLFCVTKEKIKLS